MIFKKIYLVFMLLVLLSFATAFEMSSEDYRVDSIFSKAGDNFSSEDYNMNVVLDTITGEIVSDSYKQHLGFFYGAGSEDESSSEELPGGDETPGGGSSGGVVITPKFSINPERFDISLAVNTNKEEVIMIKNLGNDLIKLDVMKDGLDNLVMFENNSIEIAAGESKEFSIVFVALNNTGIFTGRILIGNKPILVSLNIRTKLLLFDSNIAVLNHNYIVKQGDNLLTIVGLVPMGEDERLDVTLNYVIKDYNEKVYLTHSETLLIEEQMDFERSFNTGGLPVGDYIIGLELIYPNGVAPSSAYFRVIEKTKSSVIIFYFIIVALILIVFLLIYFTIKKERILRKQIKLKPNSK